MDLKRQKINILGVGVDDISFDDAILRILELAQDKRECHYVVTVNAEFVMLARRDKNFKKVLDGADLAVADGWWVVWAKKIMGGCVYTKISGVDVVEKVCEAASGKAITVGFLGGWDGIAKALEKRQNAKYSELKIVMAESGEATIGKEEAFLHDLKLKGRIDVLFVAYGMGKQEFWLQRNLSKFDVGVAIGVGGAFDYLAGKKTRAPLFMRNNGLEWLWRLIMEPWRAKRMSRVFPMFWILVIGSWFLGTYKRNS